MELIGILPDELPLKAKEASIETLEINEREAASYYSLPKLKHKDPFDRFIIWQAINTNITLITKDKEITEYTRHGLKTLW